MADGARGSAVPSAASSASEKYCRKKISISPIRGWARGRYLTIGWAGPAPRCSCSAVLRLPRWRFVRLTADRKATGHYAARTELSSGSKLLRKALLAAIDREKPGLLGDVDRRQAHTSLRRMCRQRPADRRVRGTRCFRTAYGHTISEDNWWDVQLGYLRSRSDPGNGCPEPIRSGSSMVSLGLQAQRLLPPLRRRGLP